MSCVMGCTAAGVADESLESTEAVSALVAKLKPTLEKMFQVSPREREGGTDTHEYARASVCGIHTMYAWHSHSLSCSDVLHPPPQAAVPLRHSEGHTR